MSRVSIKPRKPAPRKPLRLAPPAWLASSCLWTVVGWSVALVGAGWWLTRLEARARQLTPAPTQVEWVDPPQWLADPQWSYVRDGLLDLLEAPGVPIAEWNVHDPVVCGFVAQQLQGSAWINQVERVTKSADGVVRIKATFRKPFALVEQGAAAFLVDRNGVRLPTDLNGEYRREEWIYIRGVRGPRPAEGRSWQGEDLQAGMKLAEFFYQAELAGKLCFRPLLMAIDVSNFGRRVDAFAGVMQLAMRNPHHSIHWGDPPGEEYGVEAPAEAKLANLCKAYSQLGRLPDDVRDRDGAKVRREVEGN